MELDQAGPADDDANLAGQNDFLDYLIVKAQAVAAQRRLAKSNSRTAVRKLLREPDTVTRTPGGKGLTTAGVDLESARLDDEIRELGQLSWTLRPDIITERMGNPPARGGRVKNPWTGRYEGPAKVYEYAAGMMVSCLLGYQSFAGLSTRLPQGVRPTPSTAGELLRTALEGRLVLIHDGTRLHWLDAAGGLQQLDLGTDITL